MKQTNPHAISTRHFLLALVIVLGGVALGSIVVVKMSQKPGENRYPISSRAAPPRTRADPTNMVWIAGGTFWMGSEAGNPDEQPSHRVRVDGFWIDKNEVTNEEFEKFVRETHYV